jgi:hypothetical protein
MEAAVVVGVLVAATVVGFLLRRAQAVPWKPGLRQIAYGGVGLPRGGGLALPLGVFRADQGKIEGGDLLSVLIRGGLQREDLGRNCR